MADEIRRVCEPIVAFVGPYLELARLHTNEVCAGLEPWQIIAFTFGFTVLLAWIWDFLFQEELTLWQRLKKSFFKLVKSIPFVKRKIEAELDNTVKGIEESFDIKGQKYMQCLPSKGIPQEKLLKLLEEYKKLSTVNWETGCCSGTVYSGQNDLTELMAKVYRQFAWSNPLHPDVFPDIRKMEAEVVRMACTMFRGSSNSCGTMTSGGTESIMLACKAYRDMAYERGIKYPEMIVPITVHAAFDKAAQFFRMRITHIPVDEETRQCDAKAMKRAINKSTCMLVGSAPSFPHGIIDPIVEIGKLGKKYKIPVHVDSCLGGFLVPFMEKAGFPLEPFDFTVPGVVSISADTHKFGFAPKGSSVILYSDKSYRAFQYFVQPDWTGGLYASPTFAGSRAGAIIAACWATMVYMGEDGYVDSTQKIISVTRYITEKLREIEGIFVYGEPKVCVVGVGSNDFNVYFLSDALAKKGWNLNALQFPSSLHLCCTFLHTKPGVADRFIADMKDTVAAILKEPNAKAGGQAAIYGMAQSIPDRTLVGEIVGSYFDAYYSTREVETKNGSK